MTPVTKQAWIDALRSDEYKQGVGALARRDSDGNVCYCCLGVLADLAGVKTNGVESELGILEFDFDGSIEEGIIPLSFRDTILEDVDLNVAVESDDKLSQDDLMRTLSSKNDRGASFNQIADYLENLP